MPRFLVQATLPHRRLEATSFERQNGSLHLSIRAHPDVGLPYGRYPRLLLIWLTTQVVRKRSPVLEIGLSMSRFMAQLGLIPSGGRQGTIRRLRDQMTRLFYSTIAFTYDHQAERPSHDSAFRVSEYTGLWRHDGELDQPAPWGSRVRAERTLLSGRGEQPCSHRPPRNPGSPLPPGT